MPREVVTPALTEVGAAIVSELLTFLASVERALALKSGEAPLGEESAPKETSAT